MTKQPLLNQKWFNLCKTEKEKEELGKRLLESKDIFKVLTEQLNQKLKANSKRRRDKSAYDKPAFSEFQADCNAYERALEEITTFINI